MIENFHFIRPLWFYALFGLAFVLYLLTKHRVNQSPWQQFLPEHLAKALLNDSENKQANKQNTSTVIFLLKPFVIGLLAIIALAGPTWEKLPQPVYQVEKGSVLIMDMSYSMYATDIKPNRLTRARFKAIDLLDNLNEGDIGLVAYAGDAFVISPLTQDINNIELLLPSLTPDIMPELGSNPLAALTIAHEMLTNAGHLQGNIYWFTDGIDSEDIEDITAWSTKHGHKLNILGIGTENGAPITLPSGKLLKDNSGSIVVPKLPISYLKTVAKYGHGVYQSISNDNKDIEALTFEAKNSTKQDQNSLKQNDTDENQSFGDQWQELGPWLLLIILPLVLNYFRRGALLVVMPLAFLLFPAPNTFAQEDINTQTETSAEAPFYKSAWQSLWKTDNQVAQEKFNQQNYQEAAKKFNDKNWQGSAYYKAGNYQQALEAFQQSDSSDALYNQGNALAKLEQYDDAISAYKKALEKNPNLQDAQDNIDKIEAMKKEQEQQQKQQSDKDQSKEQEQEQDKNKDQQKGDQSDQNQSQQDKSQDSSKNDQKDEPKNNDQTNKNKSEQDKQQEQNQEQSKSEQEKQKAKDEAEQKRKEQQAKQDKDQKEKDQQKAQQSPAQLSEAEEKAKETAQKHQQLLNKVTDDPYLLLRNKMQLEYQKRKQNNYSSGAKKKW